MTLHRAVSLCSDDETERLQIVRRPSSARPPRGCPVSKSAVSAPTSTLAFLAASAASLTLLTAAPSALADGAQSRHPQRSDARRKPAGVPTDYIFTHNGFFHASCVYLLQ